MMNFTRYAVYYAPQPGAFAEFAADWLGWDAATGTARPHPQINGLPASIPEITETPRKYGFHGTIKPPFRLASGTTRDQLETALAELAGTMAPVEMSGLHVHRLGRFLALTPTGDTGQLSDLAATVVKTLDPFRALPTEAELEKRRKANLSPAQEAHLQAWGYPYVLDEFRFHLTLTGRMPKAQVAEVESALQAAFAPLMPSPFRVEDLCLFGEREDGRFQILHRYALTG